MTEAPAVPPDVVLAGRLEPEEAGRYLHVPFAVPDGVRQLHVRYEYSERIPSDPLVGGGNTLDIGLFDERGTAAGGPGFRGWSGSNKLAFTVDAAWATPPYRPGPIGAGTWHVLLGPYKVSPRGLEYRVEIWFDAGLQPEERTAPLRPALPTPALPPPTEPGWVRTDLHSHTVYSDGDSWPDEVLGAAAAAGLDVLGITDHNSARADALRELGGAGLPVVLPGVEVTTYGGHWNAWGVDRWFDFREPTPEATAAAMGEAGAAGAFVSVNHPRPFGPAWEYGDGLGYHAIEVWNGPWEHLNTLALARWEAHLRRGERIVAVGGSDTHHLRRLDLGPLAMPRLGQPTTWLRVDGPLTAEAVLDALRQGRCFVSATPAGPQLYLDAAESTVRVRVVGGRGAALLVLSAAGCVVASPITADDWEQRMPYPSDAAYLRAQVVDGVGDMLALSNPVWRDDQERATSR